jgi:hypothetical protein
MRDNLSSKMARAESCWWAVLYNTQNLLPVLQYTIMVRIHRVGHSYQFPHALNAGTNHCQLRHHADTIAVFGNHLCIPHSCPSILISCLSSISSETSVFSSFATVLSSKESVLILPYPVGYNFLGKYSIITSIFCHLSEHHVRAIRIRR